MTKENRDIQRKLKVVRHAEKTGHVARNCRYFGIGRSSFYRWKANAIDFVDHIIEKFPFRSKEIRTDNGHEFRAKFHWHVEDQGIRHA